MARVASAIHTLIIGKQRLVPFQGLGEPPLIAVDRRVGQARFDFAEPAFNRFQLRRLDHRGFQQRFARRQMQILRQAADAYARLYGDMAAVRLDLAQERLEQGRLAGAIGSHQGDAVAIADRPGEIAEELDARETDGDAAGLQKAHYQVYGANNKMRRQDDSIR